MLGLSNRCCQRSWLCLTNEGWWCHWIGIPRSWEYIYVFPLLFNKSVCCMHTLFAFYLTPDIQDVHSVPSHPLPWKRYYSQVTLEGSTWNPSGTQYSVKEENEKVDEPPPEPPHRQVSSTNLPSAVRDWSTKCSDGEREMKIFYLGRNWPEGMSRKVEKYG